MIFTGRAAALERFAAAGEFLSDGRMAMVILHGASAPGARTELPTPTAVYKPTTGDLYFSHDRARQPVAEEFWPLAAARAAAAAANDLKLRCEPCARVEGNGCSLWVRRMAHSILDVAIENRTAWERITRTVRLNIPIEKIEILSSFPLRPSRRDDEKSFTVPVPPRGISVARLYLKKANFQPNQSGRD